jgi:hypothetical protein
MRSKKPTLSSGSAKSLSKKKSLRKKKPTVKKASNKIAAFVYGPHLVTNYLRQVFDVGLFPIVVKKMSKAINEFRRSYPVEAIAFTGVSGSAMAFPISYELNLSLVCIRRHTDPCHFDGGSYEGMAGIKNYIIVDDMIDTGSTVRYIQEEVRNKSPKAICQGIFLFNDAGNLVSEHSYCGVPLICVR